MSLYKLLRGSTLTRGAHWVPLFSACRLLSSENNEIARNVPEELHSEPDELDEEKIKQLRDVSRMKKQYHDRMLHVMNPPEPLPYIKAIRQTPSQRRQLYGKYGRKSGIDPGELWPTESQLEEQIDFEKEWEPSLQQMWARLNEERKQDEAEKQEKREHVDKQLAKMPEFINQYKVKLSKAEKLKQESKRKDNELMEEARDFFGYYLDPRDPRFEQLVLEKAEEEKRLKKKKKKEEKMAKLVSMMRK